MIQKVRITSTDPYFETREQTLIGIDKADINNQIFDLYDYLREMERPYEVKVEPIGNKNGRTDTIT